MLDASIRATDSVTLMPRRDTPNIPPELRDKWDELMLATRDREDAEAMKADASARARPLVVELLRGGVRRQDLVDRPFSSAELSNIQREYGVSTRRPQRGLHAPDGGDET